MLHWTHTAVAMPTYRHIPCLHPPTTRTPTCGRGVGPKRRQAQNVGSVAPQASVLRRAPRLPLLPNTHCAAPANSQHNLPQADHATCVPPPSIPRSRTRAWKYSRRSAKKRCPCSSQPAWRKPMPRSVCGQLVMSCRTFLTRVRAWAGSGGWARPRGPAPSANKHPRPLLHGRRSLRCVVVWCGALLCGVVWCGALLCCVVQCGVVY